MSYGPENPITYTVGSDLTLTEYEDIVRQLTEWFRVSRATTDPEAVARDMLDRCCKGITNTGDPWKKMWNADLATRIRAKCLYDIEQKRGVGATLEQLKEAKERAKRKKAMKTWDPKRKRDPMISEEAEAVLGPKAAEYGDNPHVQLSSKEEVEWHRLYNGYLKQFPELRSINASSELKIVVDLQILADRWRHKIMSGKTVEVDGLTKITKELSTLKTALGIHPDQIAKRVKPKTESTIGAAVLKLEAMPDYREIRSRFQLEEFLQMYQMYHSPRADGMGYQLDEPGFFAQTRCRTCECAGCGKRNAAGFSVEEIEAYLLKQGAIEPLPMPEEPQVPMGWTAATVVDVTTDIVDSTTVADVPVTYTEVEALDQEVTLEDLSDFAHRVMSEEPLDP